jgi:hypothetical protein
MIKKWLDLLLIKTKKEKHHKDVHCTNGYSIAMITTLFMYKLPFNNIYFFDVVTIAPTFGCLHDPDFAYIYLF